MSWQIARPRLPSPAACRDARRLWSRDCGGAGRWTVRRKRKRTLETFAAGVRCGGPAHGSCGQPGASAQVLSDVADGHARTRLTALWKAAGGVRGIATAAPEHGTGVTWWTQCVQQHVQGSLRHQAARSHAQAAALLCAVCQARRKRTERRLPFTPTIAWSRFWTTTNPRQDVVGRCCRGRRWKRVQLWQIAPGTRRCSLAVARRHKTMPDP